MAAENVQRAKWAQEAKRWDDMVAAMKSVAETGVELSNEERDLLFDAYEKVVVTRKSSLKKIRLIEEETERSEWKQQIAKEYREEVEAELSKICLEVLSLLDKFLIPKASNDESKVLYLMMKGDHYRLLAEVATGHTRNALAADSQKAYQEGWDISKSKLETTHPFRLGIALNFSVLYFEILSRPEEAYNLAKQALTEARPMLLHLNEDKYKESACIVQLLQDNLSSWTHSYYLEEESSDDEEAKSYKRWFSSA